MIEQSKSGNLTQIILAPNKSMSWETNKKILLAIFLVNMTIALAWTAVGAWMVLPFAGLEVFLVGLGMYYVSWKLNFKQIIQIDHESFILQKGVYFPKQEWRWQTSQVVVIDTPSKYRLSPTKLTLKHLNQTVQIGDFLNREEKKTLRKALIDLGLKRVLTDPE